jgi:hypothetical protein
VAINNIKDTTQASISDAIVIADAIDVKSNNRNTIVAATGGLALSLTNSGGNAVSLAGALSYNGVESSTIAFVRDANLTLRSVDFETFVVESTDTRMSVLADNFANIWTLSAGGAGAIAGGGTATGTTVTGSLAGSVSLNTISGPTRAKLIDTTVTLDTGPHRSDVRVLANDSSQIFAIAGSLSLSIAKGGSSTAVALSAGVAIAVNRIATDTDALVESSNITWTTGSKGDLNVKASSKGSIKSFTVAGAISGAAAKQSGSGVGAAGAGSGSVNIIDADTRAIVRKSTIDAVRAVNVEAKDESSIIAGAGAVAIAVGLSGQGTAAAASIGGSFAINSNRR